MTVFGTGSNSNGQFWFGGNNFPGFLYKKSNPGGARKSTLFGPGGNIVCNSKNLDIWNQYHPGQGGIGASSIATRRAKNRLATVCTNPLNTCGSFYMRLGQYNNSYNVNGFYQPTPI